MTRRRRLVRRAKPPVEPDRIPATSTRHHKLLGLLFLGLISTIAYLNADHEEFYFDSKGGRSIENQRVRDLGGMLHSTWKAPWVPGSQLPFATFAVNYALNEAVGLRGFDVTTFLAFNVMVHALNACLVFLLVATLLRQVDQNESRSMWIPLAVATLFAVHPMHASSVAYILQRRGTMATAFYLFGILAYLRFRKRTLLPDNGRHPPRSANTTRPNSSSTWRRLAWLAAIPLFYWLSIRSKPLGLTLPFAILAVELCLRAPNRRALRPFLPYLAGVFTLTFVGILVFLWSRNLFDPSRMEVQFWGKQRLWGLWPHFLTEARVFVHYWKLLLLPLPQWCSLDHKPEVSWTLLEHGAFLAVLFHGLLLGLAVLAAFKRRPLAAIGILWFYIALIPYAFLPQVELMVEYKTYLPSVGLILIVAEGCRYIRSRRVSVTVQRVGVLLAVGLLLLTTVRRNMIYQNSYNLWADAAEKSPHHPRPHNDLGIVLKNQGKLDEAIAEFRTALRIAPNYSKAYTNLANALVLKGKYAEAISNFEQSLRLDPDSVEASNDLGMALARQGRMDEAVPYFEKVLEADPDYATAHSNLGNVLAAQGKSGQAMIHYWEAIRLQPYFADVYNNLATLLLEQGKVHEAVKNLRRAVELKPGYVDAYCNLGVALSSEGKFDEAVQSYQTAIDIDPDNVKANEGLRGALARQTARSNDPSSPD